MMIAVDIVIAGRVLARPIATNDVLKLCGPQVE